MDKLVDFSQPIEAVHDSGQVIPAAVHARTHPDGGAYVSGHFPALKQLIWFGPDNSGGLLGWTVRNIIPAKPSTPSNEELTQRMEIAPEIIADMVALMREMAGPPIAQGNTTGKAINILARIDLPKPVDPIDPDLIEARRIAEAGGYTSNYEPELGDNSILSAILGGIKLGRTLAAGGTAHE